MDVRTIILVALFCFSVSLEGQNRLRLFMDVQPVVLRPTVFDQLKPKYYQITYRQNYSTQVYRIDVREDVNDFSYQGFFSTVVKEKDYLEIIITSPGYKTLRSNILVSKDMIDKGRINVGVMALKKLKLPNISPQVDRYVRRGEATKYRIRVDNPFDRVYTILKTKLKIEVSVEGRRKYFSDPNRIVSYDLQTNLRINYSCDNEINVDADVALSPEDDFVLISNGNIVFNQGRESCELEFEIKNQVDIPGKQKSYIELVLPESLQVNLDDDFISYLRNNIKNAPIRKKNGITYIDIDEVIAIDFGFQLNVSEGAYLSTTYEN